MDIAIIGAGPIGCYLGQLLKQQGFSHFILEEHPEIGVPSHCAGLVGKSFFKDSKISLPENVINNILNGAIISYKNHRFILRKERVAFVIDRKKLDRELSLGLNIKKEVKLLNMDRKNNRYILYTNKGNFYSDIVIGADGAASLTRRLAGLKLKPIYYKGIQVRMKEKVEPQDMAQVDFIKPFLFFSWVIPEGNGVVRVGNISPNPAHNFKLFLNKLRFQGEIIEKMGGVLSIGYGQTFKDNIAVVGDAACQVKPLSGGGLYYGMRCAEILADCIVRGNISSYDGEWKKMLGGEIKTALKIRKILERRSLSFLEKLFEIARENSHIIEQIADFERHSFSVFNVIKRLGIIIPGIFLSR